MTADVARRKQKGGSSWPPFAVWVRGRTSLSAYSGEAGASSSSAASLDQLSETPPQSLTSLLLGKVVVSSIFVTFVPSSTLMTKWSTGVIEKTPAVNGTPAERSM